MSGTIKPKVLQAIIFVFQTSITAISGLFDYCVFKKCKVDDLEGFLNKFEYKHTLFHLYNNDVTCCKCDTKFPGRSQVLKKVEFEKLYKDTGRSHPHIERNEKGTITQVCICDYEAKPGITLNDLDITLMAKILRNSCKKLVPPTALNGVDEIKERRNRLCHAGSLDSFKESEMDKMLQDLETYVREVIKNVPQTSFQTSIRDQIFLLKSSQIQQAEAIHIIRETECILEAEKQKLINIIDGNTKKLEVKMENLHQCYKEGTEDLKKTQECHTLQIKQGIHDMEHRVKDDNKTMASDLKHHNDNIKTELKENQEVIKTTQKEHTEKLTSIKNISGDVLQTAKQTERQQLKQTNLIETIQNSVEQLEANDMNKEDKKKIIDCINTLKNMAVSMGIDVGNQTDVECMQFELGENSKTALECIRVGTDNIKTQNDQLKDTLQGFLDSVNKLYSADRLTKEDALRRDFGCQTDSESMEFVLTEPSINILESIQTGTKNVESKLGAVVESIERLQSHEGMTGQGTRDMEQKTTEGTQQIVQYIFGTVQEMCDELPTSPKGYIWRDGREGAVGDIKLVIAEFNSAVFTIMQKLRKIVTDILIGNYDTEKNIQRDIHELCFDINNPFINFCMKILGFENENRSDGEFETFKNELVDYCKDMHCYNLGKIRSNPIDQTHRQNSICKAVQLLLELFSINNSCNYLLRAVLRRNANA